MVTPIQWNDEHLALDCQWPYSLSATHSPDYRIILLPTKWGDDPPNIKKY